ncbi:MAG: VCBS repeat-containing protein [Flavobacteriales bacterium]|nr:MAG: VCBS repeat-containing protein [Flavobacteriales bacterium]
MHIARPVTLLLALPVLLAAACGGGGPDQPKQDTAADAPLLRPVPASESGLAFSNAITETSDLNYFTYQYMYNGGGVAVGDLNNDGLQDVYFTGNQVHDRLYLNKGGLKFEDVTRAALPLDTLGWRTGVSMADVNNDGLLDIYVCRSGPSFDPALTTNLLYINQGPDAKGVPAFTEEAERYGIADTTHSTQAVFFDMDSDGDLDLYVMNHPHLHERGMSNVDAMNAIRNRTAPTSRLFRNDLLPSTGVAGGGHGTFTDITYEDGMQTFAYSLGVSVSDLDHDGKPDLYVANDYDIPDLMYMNQGNGRFLEQVQARTGHMSNFGMGTDAADYNNDGWADIVVLDMTAEDHVRNKTNMASMSPAKFWNNVRGGMGFQYMLNTLHLNNGPLPPGCTPPGAPFGGYSGITFSEVGQMAGMARTDWSWAPLLCDLDNDGWKDLVVTNGFKRDMRNNDFVRKFETYVDTARQKHTADLLELVPSNKLRNFLYRNKGDLTFENVSEKWGFTEPVNSNGAAYADLDNDGDLDVLINNIDAPASLYENTATQQHSERHWLRVKLNALPGRSAFGAKVTVKTDLGAQYQELYPVRGYQSCVEPVLHFGLGEAKGVWKIEVVWPDGRSLFLHNQAFDTSLIIHDDGREMITGGPLASEGTNTVGRSLDPASIGLDFRHEDPPYDDFKLEVLLPHQMSILGPMLGSGDANGDGLDDLFIGGGHGQSGALYLQRRDGNFVKASAQPWSAHAAMEDMGSLFFDADGDGDNDLLVLSGSNEHDVLGEFFLQRLYTNDGKGTFTYAPDALPPMATSAQRACAGDVDRDGDPDLFIGGRQTPAHYPFAPRSYLLRNDDGRFTDITEMSGNVLMGPGMVTDCEFADMDGDKDLDLVLVGEWMPVSVFRNTQGVFFNATEELGFTGSNGWWSSLAVADMDGDGDNDLVTGNLGWNSKFKADKEHPLHVYWADFDGNGRSDIVLSKEKDGKKLPVRGRECSSQQCPMILEKFPTYDAFAHSDLEGIYSAEKLSSALHLTATLMHSGIWTNNGGTFAFKPFPNIAQVAPINGIIVHDVDGDGKQDVITAGNNWGAEVETARYDAGIGCVLLNKGDAGFIPMTSQASGFYANGNVKDLALLKTTGAPLLVVANNSDVPGVFRLNATGGGKLAAVR